jgi:Flp pilus assembly protein TadG
MPSVRPNLTPTRRGAAALELAILLPFLVLMFAAAVDVARVFHVTQVMESAAYAGAVYASGTAWAPGPGGDLIQAAKSAVCANGALMNLPLQPTNVTVAPASKTVAVTVDYDFPLVTAVLTPSGTVHLRRTVTMNSAPRPGD